VKWGEGGGKGALTGTRAGMDCYFIEKRPVRTSVFKIIRRTHAVPSLLENLTTEAAQSNMSACKLARRHACMHDCALRFLR